MSSAAQIEANQKNAKLSTGPTSPDGKAKVSHNALKTGLTGRTVVLPTDGVAADQAHTDRVFKEWALKQTKRNASRNLSLIRSGVSNGSHARSRHLRHRSARARIPIRRRAG